jgi:transposase
MSGSGLFGDLPETAMGDGQDGGGQDTRGRPRMRSPQRDQPGWELVDLDSLIEAEHPVRVIWTYVSGLDLSVLEDRIAAREHTVGQAPASPRLLLALWLYATADGVGSARALARLCESHVTYRWLCGGVSVNYHGLADFRTAQGDVLDGLLVSSAAGLALAGAINLDEVVQDGVRVRAAAGAGSFRRKKNLHKELRKARRVIEQLKRETGDDPDASNRRIRAARQRAAGEREARVAEALKAMAELEAQRQRRARTNKQKTEKQKEPRASTTDPQARVMKMADGGYRPAYNCQLATVAQGQIVVALDVTAVGSDRGLARPMIERIAKAHRRLPLRHLVDGGFTKNADIEWTAAHGIEMYAPAIRNKHNTDPWAPRRGDGPGVAAWRRRMRSAEGKTIYRRRAMGEWINARLRNGGLRQFTVRGLEKVKAVLRLHALANNILAGHRLLQAAAA